MPTKHPHIHTTRRRLAQAEALIAAVHDALGRERRDSAGGAAAAAPAPRLTRGGLRVGKPDPEGECSLCVLSVFEF